MLYDCLGCNKTLNSPTVSYCRKCLEDIAVYRQAKAEDHEYERQKATKPRRLEWYDREDWEPWQRNGLGKDANTPIVGGYGHGWHALENW